ncbi:SAM-dependent DNA methyltransferase [Levilactobacillus namurensis]|uniref:SAM-dependent DNA methyltransferase n=1 Tax=Levilactobacillus namurensis TaxID=380393 RepID=UPI0026E97219|nr:SAM-dependent DNA methyltransferase [Levilactobacillus namurensis]
MEKFDFETVNRLLGIAESFKAPEAIMDFILNKDKRRMKFREFLQVSTDMSFDWFHEYFESEQSDRKHKKQDFTPQTVATILNRIVGGNHHRYFEPAAGTGGVVITRWWQDCLKESPMVYMPHEHFYYCEELSERAIPFLLFNLAIRGMNAIVWNGDSLSRECRGVFLIENPQDDVLGFSDINVMPYNDDVQKAFNVSVWDGDHYPEHTETDLNEWAFNVTHNEKLKKGWGDLFARVEK